MLVHLTLRPPTTKDADAIERLAIIDSARRTPAPILVAESDGDLVAAVAEDGSAIADPFRPTADVVALMRYALKHAA